MISTHSPIYKNGSSCGQVHLKKGLKHQNQVILALQLNKICHSKRLKKLIEKMIEKIKPLHFFRVPHIRARSDGDTSKLSYTPQNTMDYGTLLCSASNTVGEQRKPCVFHIIMAGKPSNPWTTW